MAFPNRIAGFCPCLPFIHLLVHASFFMHFWIKKNGLYLFLFLSPYLRLTYPSSSMLPLLQGAFSELLSYSLFHTLGTRYVALYPYLFIFNLFTKPETHNVGFINGIHEPPEAVPHSTCVFFCLQRGCTCRLHSSLPVLKGYPLSLENNSWEWDRKSEKHGVKGRSTHRETLCTHSALTGATAKLLGGALGLTVVTTSPPLPSTAILSVPSLQFTGGRALWGWPE